VRSRRTFLRDFNGGGISEPCSKPNGLGLCIVKPRGRCPLTMAQHPPGCLAPAVPIFVFQLKGYSTMKTLHLRMTEPVRVRTTDAARYDEGVLGAALADLETKIGLLEPGDLSRIRAILQKYCAGSASVTTATGVTRAGDGTNGDVVGAARKSAAVVASNISHNQAVARGYKTFWDANNRELRDSILR
jgi:hypothetical protein